MDKVITLAIKHKKTIAIVLSALVVLMVAAQYRLVKVTFVNASEETTITKNWLTDNSSTSATTKQSKYLLLSNDGAPVVFNNSERETVISPQLKPFWINSIEVSFKDVAHLDVKGQSIFNCPVTGEDERDAISYRCNTGEVFKPGFTESNIASEINTNNAESEGTIHVSPYKDGLLILSHDPGSNTGTSLHYRNIEENTVQRVNLPSSLSATNPRLKTNPGSDVFTVFDSQVLVVFDDDLSSSITYTDADIKGLANGYITEPILLDDKVFLPYLPLFNPSDTEDDDATNNKSTAFVASVNQKSITRVEVGDQKSDGFFFNESTLYGIEGDTTYSYLLTDTHLKKGKKIVASGEYFLTNEGPVFNLNDNFYLYNQSDDALYLYFDSKGLSVSGVSVFDNKLLLSLAKQSWSAQYIYGSVSRTNQEDQVAKVLRNTNKLLSGIRTLGVNDNSISVSFSDLDVGPNRQTGEVEYSTKQFNNLKQDFLEKLRSANIDTSKLEVRFSP